MSSRGACILGGGRQGGSNKQRQQRPEVLVCEHSRTGVLGRTGLAQTGVGAGLPRKRTFKLTSA